MTTTVEIDKNSSDQLELSRSEREDITITRTPEVNSSIHVTSLHWIEDPVELA